MLTGNRVVVFMSTMWLIFSIDAIATSSMAIAPFDSAVSRLGSNSVRAMDKSCFDIPRPYSDTATGLRLSSNDTALPSQVAYLRYTGKASFSPAVYIIVPSDVPDGMTLHGSTYGIASTMDLEEAVCEATEPPDWEDSEVICRPVANRPALFTPTAIIPSLGKIVYRSTNTTGRLRASSLHTLDLPRTRKPYPEDVFMTPEGFDHYYNIVAVEMSVYRIQYVKSGSTYHARSMEEADATESGALIRPMLTGMSFDPIYCTSIADTDVDVGNDCVGFGVYNLTRNYNQCVLDGDEDTPGPCRDVHGMTAVSVALAEHFSRHSAAAAGHVLVDGLSGKGMRSLSTVANGPVCMFVTAVIVYGLVAFCALLWNARSSNHTTTELASACDTCLGAEKARYSQRQWS